jgi:hypothetical protein
MVEFISCTEPKTQPERITEHPESVWLQAMMVSILHERREAQFYTPLENNLLAGCGMKDMKIRST